VKYLNLIRWPYLLILVIGQILIKYAFFTPLLKVIYGSEYIPITLNDFGFSLIPAATVCLAAAGFIIHELYNVNSTTINLPYRIIKGEKISVKKAFNLFFALNVIGMLIGFYLSNMIGYPSFAVLFILTSALLYASAKGLKKYFLIRAIILSFLGALSFFAVALFDLFPQMNEDNAQTLTTFFSVIKDYSIFLFLLFFLREQIINQKNRNEHHKNGWQTLTLSLGLESTRIIIFGITLLPVLAVIFYLYKYLYVHTLSLIYGLVFILAPLLLFALKLWAAKEEKDYDLLQKIISAVIFFSILSIGLYQFILK